jgi:hypothetical protein
MFAEVGVRFDQVPLEFHTPVYAQMYITVKGRTVFLMRCSARVKILNPARFFIPLDRKPCVLAWEWLKISARGGLQPGRTDYRLCFVLGMRVSI